MKKITSVLCLYFLLLNLNYSQGVISQFADGNGYYAKFGSPNGILAKYVNIGSTTIQTSGLFNPPPSLKINQDGGNVTIGNTDADNAKLTVRADNESQVDIRVEGTGIVSTQGSFYFQVDDNNNANEYFVVESGGSGEDLFWIGENGFNFLRGNLAIGDPITNKHASGFRLSVDGKIISEEVRVELDSNWPDYVFDKDYSLMPLSQLKSEIERIGHLPGIPSAKVVEEEGFELGEMNRLLVEKVEELTLYVIELNQQIKQLQDDLK